jgi:hypothetical protein
MKLPSPEIEQPLAVTAYAAFIVSKLESVLAARKAVRSNASG